MFSLLACPILQACIYKHVKCGIGWKRSPILVKALCGHWQLRFAELSHWAFSFTISQIKSSLPIVYGRPLWRWIIPYIRVLSCAIARPCLICATKEVEETVFCKPTTIRLIEISASDDLAPCLGAWGIIWHDINSVQFLKGAVIFQNMLSSNKVLFIISGRVFPGYFSSLFILVVR